jgi:hypothetical protein
MHTHTRITQQEKSFFYIIFFITFIIPLSFVDVFTVFTGTENIIARVFFSHSILFELKSFIYLYFMNRRGDMSLI